jgi:hypothetical protein
LNFDHQMKDLSTWTPRKAPARAPIEGQWVRLEPLSVEAHGDGLFLASSVPDAAERFRFLWEQPPTSREELDNWLRWAASSRDPLFFSVIDKASGRIGGRQSFLRIDAANGVAEIGHIYWGPLVAGQFGVAEERELQVTAHFAFQALDWPPRHFSFLPATSSTSSAIVDSNGNATPTMRTPGELPSDLASVLRAFSANIWSSKAETGTQPGSHWLMMNGQASETRWKSGCGRKTLTLMDNN